MDVVGPVINCVDLGDGGGRGERVGSGPKTEEVGVTGVNGRRGSGARELKRRGAGWTGGKAGAGESE